MSPEQYDLCMDWLFSVGALAISLFALLVSLQSYRQRERYHPQPKLVVEWEPKLVPANGIFMRWGYLYNHGDAPARDVEIRVEHAITRNGKPWDQLLFIDPGGFHKFGIPVVDNVFQLPGAVGLHMDREGTPESYRMVTPEVTFSWRQPPFDRKPRTMKEHPPKTPDLLPPV